MKEVLITMLLIFICLTVIPLCATVEKSPFKAVSAKISASFETEKSDGEKFRIKNSKSGEINNYSAKEYVTGVLCGEVSPSYNKEALKAQAVAAYTFALYRKGKSDGRDFDLTDSPATDQCFFTKEAMREKWGESFEKNYEIMEKAVNEVCGQRLLYDGKPALTVYHATSPGATVSAKDVWGSDYPYLQSVDSIGDKLCKDYLSTVSVSESELKEKMSKLCKTDAAGNLFGKADTNENGFVKSIVYAGKEISGTDIQKALGLRSAAFEVSFSDGAYIFNVRGYGHGVGMSQTGADYLAKQGSNYKEILLHYYKGCEIK